MVTLSVKEQSAMSIKVNREVLPWESGACSEIPLLRSPSFAIQ